MNESMLSTTLALMLSLLQALYDHDAAFSGDLGEWDTAFQALHDLESQKSALKSMTNPIKETITLLCH